MNKRLGKWSALLVVLGLAAAACGGGTTATTGATGTTGAPATTVAGEKPTIKIVQNAWTASAIEAAITSQLISEQLGYPTEIVEIDENAMFAGLSSGDVSVVFELWPSGITPDEQAFVDDGSVTNMGELGAVGQIGWFVPKYVVDANPALATWEGYKDPAVAEQFATAETGSNGRFLGTDPSYSQFDEPIIANLELPFQVVYSGSEPATLAELDSKVAAQEPVLMYWWTPTAAVAKYDLVNVKLPDYYDGCYDDPTKTDCAYPEDVLVKLAWSEMETAAPEVWSFVQKFQFDNEMQLSLLPAVEIDGRPAADVAAEWIAANEATWSTWTS